MVRAYVYVLYTARTTVVEYNIRGSEAAVEGNNEFSLNILFSTGLLFPCVPKYGRGERRGTALSGSTAILGVAKFRHDIFVAKH